MARQTVTHLPVEQLAAHPGNVRDDLGDLAGLTGSIREHGILQPLTVTEHPDGRYLLIAGHRRLAAAQHAGLTRVPVIIRHDVTDEHEQILLMLVENTQRRDLNPIERAEAFGALRNRGLTQSEIARRTGTSPANVSRYMVLLELDEESRDEIRAGNFNVNDAISLVRTHRASTRKRDGRDTGKVGRPKGRTTTPWFGDTHPLAVTVRGLCDHRGRPKVGGVGCGPCWEQAVRDDAGRTPVEPVEREVDIDEAAVLRVLDGHWDLATTPDEKAEVARRWHASGRSLADLARKTGWKVDRYFNIHETEQEAS